MLPPLHAQWLSQLIGAAPPEEHAATCDRCVMTAPAAGEHRFDASTKCCTYQPQLPNFLVGAMLDDDSAEFAAGRASLEKRIDGRDGVTPLGVARPWAYDLEYREAMRTGDAFGRLPMLRCPHYAAATGGCNIWRYREAVCASWFCRHDRGAVGRDYWSAVRAALQTLEHALARHCVVQVGVGGAALRRLFPTDADAEPPGPVDEPTRQAQWGDWAERERAFYLACWAVASALAWPELAALGGAELQVRAQLARDAHARVQSTELPRRLRVHSLRVLPASEGHCQVTTYRAYDPVDLPGDVIAGLHRFDGRPVPEVVAELRREAGVTVDDELLRKLVDFDVLGDAASE